jgi:electron transfer flavoprotein alpha subunit
MTIEIDRDRCIACGLCEKSCPFGAITVIDGCAAAGDDCTLCGSCAGACPENAIVIPRRAVSAEALAGYRGVMVFAECDAHDGYLKPKRIVAELLSKGRELADALGQELVAVVLGDERLGGIEELGGYGADRVLKCVHPLLADFSVDGFCTVLSTVIADNKPAVLLYGATPNGRELAPRVAARLRLGLTADCTGLDIDADKRLVQTRPAFGGNIMASIISPGTRPQTATVRPNVFAANRCDRSGSMRIETPAVVLNPSMIRTKVVARECIADQEGARLDEARVVVAAGRGCRRTGDLAVAGRLAEKLRGFLACSRPLVEEGLLPHTCQVGQSGVTVGPELYIALGISGAVQHRVGMSASKTVVAINCDHEAPILAMADLGIVGDAPGIAAALLSLLEQCFLSFSK